MNVFAETKTNEEKEIYEDILGKEIVSWKWERKEDFRNVVMDLQLSLQYNYSFSLYNYSSKYEKKNFYGRPQFRKGMKITVFIKNKIICIRRFTLHSF